MPSPTCWSTSFASRVRRAARKAHDLFDAHLPLLRYEQQPGVGLAVRKYVLQKRGAIASDAQRAPAGGLSAKAKAEVDFLLERLARVGSAGGAVSGLSAGDAANTIAQRQFIEGGTAMYYGQVEGTDIVVLDPRFKACFAGHVRVERLWTGARWAEGPAWFAAGRYLVWSDIPNNRMMRYVEPSGEVSVFRERSNNSNGNSVDNQGRLVTCEHLTRRVTRTEIDGSITVLANKWNGKRLNSPNDLVVKSDDSIWFTDPAYGIDTDYEGDRADPEISGCHVYRLDAKSGEVTAVITDMVRPNGIAFSPDEKYLYVADTGATHKEKGPKHIRRFTRQRRRRQAFRRRGFRRMHGGSV